MIMGCYGIGVGRTVAAAIEQNHDPDGIVWPLTLAPFQVLITPIDWKPGSAEHGTIMALYESFQKAGIEVLLDDRDERPGIKFKDGDLIGIPFRVTIGPKGLKQGQVELRPRRSKQVEMIKIDRALEAVQKIIADEAPRL